MPSDIRSVNKGPRNCATIQQVLISKLAFGPERTDFLRSLPYLFSFFIFLLKEFQSFRRWISLKTTISIYNQDLNVGDGFFGYPHFLYASAIRR